MPKMDYPPLELPLAREVPLLVAWELEVSVLLGLPYYVAFFRTSSSKMLFGLGCSGM
jgi:hypothetical protein